MSSSLNPDRLLHAATTAAQAAQLVLLDHFHAGPMAVETKGDGSPVTRADRDAERAVRAVFAELTPDLPVFGEEDGDDAPDAALTWVVDPIDGTISFVHGLPFFGTLIALWDRRDDNVLVGVLNLPALGERFTAASGRGIQLNGAPLTPRPRVQGRTLVGIGDQAQFLASSCEPELRALQRAHPYVRAYSDAFGHAQVLRGGLDVMVDPGLSPWDLLASRCLLQEAGLSLRRRPSHGRPGLQDAILGREREVEEMAELLAW